MLAVAHQFLRDFLDSFADGAGSRCQAALRGLRRGSPVALVVGDIASLRRPVFEVVGAHTCSECIQVGLILRSGSHTLGRMIGEVLIGRRARRGVGDVGMRPLGGVTPGLAAAVVGGHAVGLPTDIHGHSSPSRRRSLATGQADGITVDRPAAASRSCQRSRSHMSRRSRRSAATRAASHRCSASADIATATAVEGGEAIHSRSTASRSAAKMALDAS